MSYELYLRGVDRLMRLNRWDTRTSIEMLENAVELDPRFADAWARLGEACVLMAGTFEPGPLWVHRAERAVRKALALDRLNQHAKKGLIAVAQARDRERALKRIPLDKVPVLKMDLMTLTKENFDPQEGFVLSRVNGQWDVQSILKLCPMAEDDALMIFARLLERKVIEFV